MEVDGDVPQEENVEIQSLKREVILVESEETQDYVRETFGNQSGTSRGNGLGEPNSGVTIAAVKKGHLILADRLNVC